MLVDCKNVSKKLGTFYLEDVSVELPEGYILGLVGPNGSGKTTFLHTLLGLYQPNQGSIRVDGKEYEKEEREIREMTGVVLLDEMFESGLTLEQNALFYGNYYSKYDHELLRQYLIRFELDGAKKYKQLSRGEKIKFEFAFALSHDAKLLVLDEPTGNFDQEFRKEFFQVLKEFIADGTRSVILATHLTEDLDRVADYLLYLEKGKVLYSGDIESLRAQYRLVTGETYKIKLLPKERIIKIEEGEFGTRALIRHFQRIHYDDTLTVAVPTIQELMYFMTKRGAK